MSVLLLKQEYYITYHCAPRENYLRSVLRNHFTKILKSNAKRASQAVASVTAVTYMQLYAIYLADLNVVIMVDALKGFIDIAANIPMMSKIRMNNN